jgi:hypothetical protein
MTKTTTTKRSEKKAQPAQVTTRKERRAGSGNDVGFSEPRVVHGETLQPAQAAQTQSTEKVRKLDRSRPFGRIEPPWAGPRGQEFLRLAFWEQAGHFYDVEDRLLTPGERAPKPAADESGELRTLDESKPYASITPPFLGDRGELDRPAFFEQRDEDGRSRLYDRNKIEVRRGKALSVKPAVPPPQQLAPNGRRPAADWQGICSPAELYQRADQLLDHQLRARAATIFSALNKPCPSTRSGIMQALMVTLGYSAKFAENWHQKDTEK